ncbi:MAG: efflux RND transporter permease subunit [Rickettsiales endosymbiont of Dermacentor nuttalli]
MFSVNIPAYNVILDRTKVKTLNVNVPDVFSTMQVYLVLTVWICAYSVYMQSESKYRETIDNLKDVFVRSNTGDMVLLSALLKVELRL